ncbi:hypothetical protein ACWF9G_28530 [Nocardia sp. NPDC055029]
MDRLLDAGWITRAQLDAHILTPDDPATVSTLRALISAHATTQPTPEYRPGETR